MKPSPVRRPLATALAAATLVLLLSPPPLAGATSFRGRVVGDDGVAARPGVTVALYDSSTDRSFRSAPTGTDGVFRVEGAPIGTYDLLVEADGGAYLAPAQVELVEGGNAPVSLRLEPAPANLQEGTVPPPGPGLSPVVKWVIVGAIVAAGLFVISEVTEDEDEPASPF